MRRATVVIGAAFGDEGKGHIVDYLADRETTVVRFNGGAQAGHTVELADGRRHAFGHHSSGTFRGARTYLSSYFVVNPGIWKKEFDALNNCRQGDFTKLYVHPQAPLTIPYDMMVNREVERIRGASKHGSCGAGLNETVTRNENPYFATTVLDVKDLNFLANRLRTIRESYSIHRFEKLTGQQPDDRFIKLLTDERVIYSFLTECAEFRDRWIFSRFLPLDGAVIFEGAQGLLLDEDHPWFPYVTRSKTGLHNVFEIAQQSGITELDVYYVLRTYMTRHGAGPFPTEEHGMRSVDKTNTPNEWQGTLRFGRMDWPHLREAIRNDLVNVHSRSKSKIKIRAGIALNHLDQIPGAGDRQTERLVVERFEKELILPVCFVSHGPRREDILPVGNPV